MSRKTQRLSLIAPALSDSDLGFVRLPRILELLQVSRSMWLKGVTTGRFPRPVRLGKRTVAWKTADIRSLLVSLAENTTNLED